MKTTGNPVSVLGIFASTPGARAESSLSCDEILAARERLRGVVLETPCAAANGWRARFPGNLFLKHEHLQQTRSFKERGAANALLQLDGADRRRGVVAASAGNHGLGLALHGGRAGIPVTLVMPVGAPRAKVERCRALGARVELRGGNFEAADSWAREIASRDGRRYVHPFDDRAVIAGQGTVALEILAQVPDLEAVVLPVGGGGLLAGATTVIRALRPDVRIVAVEPENAACFWAAQHSGGCVEVDVQPTLADGLAVSSLGATAFEVTRGAIDRSITVSEREIAHAMVRLYEAEGIEAEGAGAVALAGLLSGQLQELECLRVVALVGGANVDAATFARARRMSESPVP